MYAQPLSSVPLSGQELTEENFLKLGSAIWQSYEATEDKIREARRNFPEKQDSLLAESEKNLETAMQQTIRLAIQFATIPRGLEQLYTVRLYLPKDTLKTIVGNLPDDMRNSPYGKSILYHLETEQIEEGDRYYDFEATTDDGDVFSLASLEGKNILLLYGGLDCMGADGRDYLHEIYQKTSRDSFEIVVYCPNSNLENLQQVRTTYPCDYFLVSDFLQDHTPVKILYGAQSTPTCFFINRQGIVTMKTIGLYQDKVNRLLQLEE
jgi:peroxiredoxin